MRLNGKKIVGLMGDSGLSVETVCQRTGLFEKSFRSILENGFASDDAAERIADSIEAAVKEITLPDISGNVENSIEFLKDGDRATVSFSQGRYISRIKKLAAERPAECEIIAENTDGSICAHIPVSWIKLTPAQQLSDERRQRMADVMNQNRQKSNDNQYEKG